MECVITYCNNATDFPISNNLGYVDVDRHNGNPLPLKGLVDIGKHIQYNCISGRRLQNDTDDIGQADASVKVACNETGDYVYPEPWPTCEETVNCTDPGITEDLISTENHGQYTNHAYMAELKYECIDKRKFAKIGDSGELQPFIVSKCLWRKVYDVLGPDILCDIHHCAHPHDDNGAHPAPPPEHNISLVIDTQVSASHVPFQNTIMYKCDGTTKIENNEKDPTQNNITVQCLSTGLYDIPSEWPNCTITVSCGPPPSAPVDGSIIWMNGTENQVLNHTFLRILIINCSFCNNFYLVYI